MMKLLIFLCTFLATQTISAQYDGNILKGKKWAVCGDSFSSGDFKGSEVDYIIHEGRYEGKKKVYGYLIANRNDMTIQDLTRGGRTMATPAEGLAGRFTKRDRKDFGVLKGITDRDYYTNSNHVPVYYKCSARHKAEVEAPYHDLTRGGHIFYVEIDGDATHNPQVIMNVVDMMDRLNMGYGSVNHNRNRCMDCGYENADPHMKRCPRCGSENIDRLQRITGYLVGTTDRWNHGKLAELNDRVTHVDNGNQLELFERL